MPLCVRRISSRWRLQSNTVRGAISAGPAKAFFLRRWKGRNVLPAAGWTRSSLPEMNWNFPIWRSKMERVPLERKVLNENGRIAEELRARFAKHGVLCLNFISRSEER